MNTIMPQKGPTLFDSFLLASPETIGGQGSQLPTNAPGIGTELSLLEGSSFDEVISKGFPCSGRLLRAAAKRLRARSFASQAAQLARDEKLLDANQKLSEAVKTAPELAPQFAVLRLEIEARTVAKNRKDAQELLATTEMLIERQAYSRAHQVLDEVGLLDPSRKAECESRKQRIVQLMNKARAEELLASFQPGSKDSRSALRAIKKALGDEALSHVAYLDAFTKQRRIRRKAALSNLFVGLPVVTALVLGVWIVYIKVDQWSIASNGSQHARVNSVDEVAYGGPCQFSDRSSPKDRDFVGPKPPANQTPEEDAYRLAVDAIDAAKTEAQVDAAVRFYEWNHRKDDIEKHARSRREFLRDECAAFASFRKIAEAQTDIQVEAAVSAYTCSQFHEEVRRRADLRLAWLKERAAALEAKESVASAKGVKDAQSARGRYTGSEFKDDLDQCLAAALIRIDDREYEIALKAVREARNPEKAQLARKTYGGSRRAKELDEALCTRLDDLSADACEAAIAAAKSATAAEDARKSYSGKERKAALDKKLATRLDEIELQSFLDAQSLLKAAKTSRGARDARGRYTGARRATELDRLLQDRLWQLATSAGSLTEHTNDVTCATFSPDGKYVLTGSDDETLRLWDAGTRREIRKFEKPMSNITCTSFAAFAQSGGYSIAGCDNGCVYFWITQTGNLAATWKMGDDVLCIAASSSGEFLLVGGKKKLGAVLVDIKTGEVVRKFRGHTDDVRSIAFSPDGKSCVTASDDKTARVWEIESGVCLRVLKGHTDYVRAAAFSPDGEFVVTASDDKTVRLWRVSTGAAIRSFTGHSDYVRAVAYSPDGRYILTGSDDKTARLWDASTGGEVRSFIGHTGSIRAVAFSPDGLLLLTGSTDNSARLWAWRD